ncbi:non-heme iron oxygenase ferredoxin subunit [Bradyrhizobium sp. dw_78]|uniref:non-heme iron oxygenase ferredoxin subunit n=1 Tax=Bradyrhizobium sp. dw_78 TaxID=2719793 RepID=UPI001BD57CB7|nr:non-heme iron oxygenase ferredoxin subunit [Bradyrhizobium sp. dw_78]
MAWHRVAELTAIEEDNVIGVEVAGRNIALYRVAGKVYATDNVCTHAYALLSDGYVEDGCIECPLHQGRFEIATGKGQGAPITVDLETFLVKEEEGWALVDIA